jgi:type I restriction enzyme S subunit
MTVFRGESNKFISHWFHSSIYYKEVHKNLGATINSINGSDLKKFKTIFPLKPEQQRIAAFLTAVDNKIEQLSKKQALLGEYKKGLMQQIFSQAIRFHPKGTSSQAQGEIDDTPGQPLLPNGNSPSGSDFPDWEEKKLGDITDLITKGTTPTSVGYNFTTEGINFIKVESIKNFKIDIGSVPKISEECHHHLKRSQLKNNDIVFSIAGTLGRTAIVKNKDLPANTNQALSIIRLNRSQHILFVHYLLNLESIDKYIHRMLSVGAQPNLSLQQVGDIQLQLPSLLEQSKITNFLSSIDNKIEQVGKQLDESKQFKKALLQQMFI